MREKRADITRLLRERIARRVLAGTIESGDRLPSTRELALELHADPRVVAAAYRELADEGVVELRSRSGIYLRARAVEDPSQPPPAWLSGIMAEGIVRGVPVATLSGWIRVATSSRIVRAVVVTATKDQGEGMCHELRSDYGVRARSMTPVEALGDKPEMGFSRVVARADLIVTTASQDKWLRPSAAEAGIPYVCVSIRPDLVSLEWKTLMKRPVYVVAVDPVFVRITKEFMLTLSELPRIRYLIVGRDDLSQIPIDAPTYITQAARAAIGKTRLPGWVIPPSRIFAEDCAREIMRVVVELNLGEDRAH